jgi:endonuclease/exonuclease/phosphatase family metal-dependent hydrolase
MESFVTNSTTMNRKTSSTIIAFLLALLLLSSSTLAKTLTVVEWNLEWFPGRSPTPTEEAKQKHMEAAQKVLKQLNPDIFMAEEIGDWDSFVKLVSVVPKLQAHAVSAFKYGNTVARQQEAIASTLPPNSTWSEPWKKTEANPPRGMAFAALSLPDGKLLFVYCVHLKANGGDAAPNLAKREDSAKQIVVHVADMEKIYKSYKVLGTIIGGDFNTNLENAEWKNEKTIPTLEESGFYNTWTSVKLEQRLTWKGSDRFAATTFDFLFTKGLGKLTASLWKTTEDASDHEPVVLKIEVPDQPAP